LPVFQFKRNVLDLLSRSNVAVIAGEMGSGKSTQIPQFLLEVWNLFNGNCTMSTKTVESPSRCFAWGKTFGYIKKLQKVYTSFDGLAICVALASRTESRGA
jgi:ABC-type transport system involved in cytochrome bd biosynthesis fused ATPase/permease subunit